MNSIKKYKSNILFPYNLSEIKKYLPVSRLKNNINLYFYHSIGEIKNIYKEFHIDLVFIEDGHIEEFSIKNIKNFNSGIILICSNELKNFNKKLDGILGLISKNNLSNQLLDLTIERALANLKIFRENSDLKTQILKQEKSFVELHDIGISLSRDKDIDSLLETIITKSMQLTYADAGSLYLLEKSLDNEESNSEFFSKKHIRLKVIKNISRKIKNTPKSIFELSPKSICGYSIINGKSFIVEKFDDLPIEIDFDMNKKEIEEKYNYQVKSILIVPIFNDEKIAIGAIQLVNRKKSFKTILVDSKSIIENVIPFEKRDLYFLESIASQASVAIKNTKLIKSVHILFDGFINASVRAIESRDPTTSGHSSRVATLTIGLAETINQIHSGRFAPVNFNNDQLDEIRYASLLHDFGKIGVRERVLVKSKKLYPEELQSIIDRFKLIRTLIELDTRKKQITYFIEEPKESALGMCKKSNRELLKKFEELDEILKFIVEMNEPTIIKSNSFNKLKKISKRTYKNLGGGLNNFLNNYEVRSLSIEKGSLNENDRKEIESHVTHTYNFLKIIPWSENLKRVPEIAHAHHEKINGNGYPCKLKDNEIPLESKMMTIADIYDALTAWDRPYKKSISKERALDILFFEAKDNHIDKDLLEIFVENKLYSLVERTK